MGKLRSRVSEQILAWRRIADPLPVDDLGEFQPLVVLRPYTDIVNSVVIAQKPGRPDGPAVAAQPRTSQPGQDDTDVIL